MESQQQDEKRKRNRSSSSPSSSTAANRPETIGTRRDETPVHGGSEGEAASRMVNFAFVKCIGYTVISKRCMFIDVVSCAPSQTSSTPSTAGAPTGLGSECTAGPTHLVGDHVIRGKPLGVEPFLCPRDGHQTIVFCLFVGAKPSTSLEEHDYLEFLGSLGGTKSTSTSCCAADHRPRIGDVYSNVKGTVVKHRTLEGNGVLVADTNCTAIALAHRGPVSRPGDNGSKWRAQLRPALMGSGTSCTCVALIEEEEQTGGEEEGRPSHPQSTAQAPSTGAGANKKKKVGTPRRHQHRFRVFAEFCQSIYFPHVVASGSNGKDQHDDVDGRDHKKNQQQLVSSNSSSSRSGRSHPVSFSILDVAGGGGRLSHAFREYGTAIVPTVVDPRGVPPIPIKKVKKAAKAARRLARRQQQHTGTGVNEDVNTAGSTTHALAAALPPRDPPKDDGSVAVAVTADGGDDDPTHGGDCEAHVDRDSLGGRSSVLSVLYEEPLPTICDFFDTDRQALAIQQCDLIVGLHCDGAVNEIIRGACTFRKSFVICACCVFPHMYPRQLEDGTAVVERSQLNQWILEECRRQKYSGALGTTFLDFPGANECVYGVVSSSSSPPSLPNK